MSNKFSQCQRRCVKSYLKKALFSQLLKYILRYMLGQVGKYSELVNMCQQKYILCVEIFSTSPEICFCSENIFICPRKYILCAEIFSTPRIFVFLLPENIFMFCGNCWTSPEFYSLLQKYLVHPHFFLCHMHGFFISSHFGQAVMP